MPSHDVMTNHLSRDLIPVPSEETLRLQALHQYRILETEPERAFTHLAMLAAQLCQAPIALIGFVDRRRQWFKAVVGWVIEELDREFSFCTHTILQPNVLMVPDATVDPRFLHNPLVTREPGIRFYAGAPLLTPDGFALGTICVFDRVVRSLTPDQQSALQLLSQQVMALLELRQKTIELEEIRGDRDDEWQQENGLLQSFQVEENGEQLEQRKAEATLRRALRQLENLKFAVDEHSIIAITNDRGMITYINDRFCEVSRYSREELIGQNHRIVNSGYHPKEFFADLWRTISSGQVWRGEICNRAKDGSLYWVDSTIVPMLGDRGHSVQYIAIRTEITRRKETELQLLERSQLAELAATIGLTLAQGGHLSTMLHACAEAVVQYLEVPFIRIWTLDPETQLLNVQAIAGQHRHRDDFCNCIPLGISIIGFIAQTGQPYFTDKAPNDVCIGAKAWLEQEGLASFAGYPLVIEDRVVGVMALFHRHAFGEMVLKTLSGIANSIAVAIDRTWAREALLSRREALLFRLASEIRNSLNLDVILSTTVNEIRTLLKIDRCHFLWCWMNDEHPALVVTHESREPELLSFVGDCPADQLKTLADKVLSQQIFRVNDVQADNNLTPEVQQIFSSTGIAAQLLVPLENRQGQLGAIVCSHGEPHLWSDSEVELLHAVVDQVAIAMDQAELYAKTRAAAMAAETQAGQLSEALHHLQQTQTQLIQTEKMSSLGQMVAGIAHEINNPVNFINGNLTHAHAYIEDLLKLIQLYQEHYPKPHEAIQEQIDTMDLEFLVDDLPKLLDSMKIGGDRIRQIVLSLRSFSRLDEAEMKPVNIHEGIDSTLLILHSRLKANAGHSEIEVIRAYGKLPKVECYAGQLNQVFMNILANAIDALEEQPDPRVIMIYTQFIPEDGETPVDENTEVDPDAQGMIQINICDNGPGMSPEVQEKLFDPFFTTKPVGKGTGLGMSISYQIVQKHRGSLECCSEVGRGTEFIIRIPSSQSQKVMAQKMLDVTL